MWPIAISLAAAEVPVEAPEARVAEVRVSGAVRVDEAVIRAAIGVSPGAALAPAAVRRDLAALWATGLFVDVRVLVDDAAGGAVVTYVVRERPAMRSFAIEGNRKLDADELSEVVELAEWTVPTDTALAAAAARMQGLYREKGYYLAAVRPVPRPVSDGVVDVVFAVDEGHKVRVRSVDLVGNSALTDREVARYLQTKAAGTVPALLGRGAFVEEALATDAAIVGEVYREHGFVDVVVGRPSVYLAPDGRWVTVQIPVDEGPKYVLGAVSAEGEFAPEQGLTEGAVAAITHDLTPGDVFAISKVRAVTQRIADLYGDEGYAFADVLPLPYTQPDPAIVDLTFAITKGERFHVGTIDIVGNDPTLDKVVRREIVLDEGALYSRSQIEESQARIRRLGFFEDVSFDLVRTTDDLGRDAVDVNVRVKERPTGSATAGLGAGASSRWMVQANFTEQNLFGRGYTGTLAVDWAATHRNGSVSFADPYLFDTNWTFGASLYSRRDNGIAAPGGSWGVAVPSQHDGVSLDVGRRLGARDATRFGLSYRWDQGDLLSTTAYQRRLYAGQLFAGGASSTLGAALTVDRRDDRLNPTDGVWFSAGADLTGGWRLGDERYAEVLGGDFALASAHATVRAYRPLWDERGLVLRVQSRASAIGSTDGRVVPYVLRYREGGPDSVRGYLRNTLGPTIRVAETDDPQRPDQQLIVGGTSSWVNNVELQAPIVPQAQISGVAFFDAGGAFGAPGDKGLPDTFDLRYGVGAGLRWQSPMGLIRVEYGYPLTPQPGGRLGGVEMSFGAQF